MKKANESYKTMDVISFADFCRCMRQTKAENPNITEEELNALANDLIMTVPLLDGKETESMDDVQMIGVLSREGADPDPVLDEVLSSMGTLFKPLP